MYSSEAFKHSLQSGEESLHQALEFSAVAGISGEDVASKEAAALFAMVWKVALLNIVFSLIRPDPYISWTLKLPRVLWEVSLATMSRRTGSSQQQSSLSPTRFLVLATMLIPTALMDIFLWSPIFAAMVDFKSCQGGWFTGEPYRCQPDYVKGYGRLAVVVQSLFGGILYLYAGISAWNLYSTQSDRQRLAREVLVKRQLMEPPPAASPQRSFPYSLGLGNWEGPF